MQSQPSHDPHEQIKQRLIDQGFRRYEQTELSPEELQVWAERVGIPLKEVLELGQIFRGKTSS